ncbi:quinoprotein dehydrogenase-associated SoxYZ-like carrier [Mameliella sediminis]|uniref:quinoprotein dehydrogenase-associated SoxYZ-like carrier n=1 Tax=Mameliella sediminis TaxID=2836866 RepID=UPI001C491E0E|nr:quinoprotein dehydrogenase-associated SoxYZ-like carrier [Mameliella sediminis]MBV7395199.1 quinoprotein dehydrogenase-associated SoxYZ-like carrier [Mameliella sediminis]
MFFRTAFAAILAVAGTAALALDDPQTPLQDPMESGMWDYHQKGLLGDPADIRFDDRVVVRGPVSAEDSLNVPLLVDATAIPEVKRIVVSADYGPIPHILTYYPQQAQAKLALRFKIDQATAIRASVETKSGQWFVGSAYIDAAGGGCTAPAHAYASDDWEEKLGEVHGRLWAAAGRARLVVDHPMDTGLADGIPVFIIEDLALQAEDGTALARLELREPVNEDPAFTFYFAEGALPASVKVVGRDNNGNKIRGLLSEGELN